MIQLPVRNIIKNTAGNRPSVSWNTSTVSPLHMWKLVPPTSNSLVMWMSYDVYCRIEIPCVACDTDVNPSVVCRNINFNMLWFSNTSHNRPADIYARVVFWVWFLLNKDVSVLVDTSAAARPPLFCLLLVLEISPEESKCRPKADVKIINHWSEVRRAMEDHPRCCFSLIASVNGSLIKALNGSGGRPAD